MPNYYSIIFSSPWDFGGWGLPNITHHQALALYDEGILNSVICKKNNQNIIPKKYIFESSDIFERKVFIRNSMTGTTLDPSFLGFESCEEQKMLKEFCGDYRGKILKALNSTYPTVRQDILFYQKIKNLMQHGIKIDATDHKALRNSILEMENINAFSAPSEFVKKSFISAGIKESKISVIPCGVDTDAFFPERSQSKKLRIGFSATDPIRKGVIPLVDEFRNLKFEKTLNLRTTVSINMEFVNNYEYMDDMKFLYNNSDVFILPSAEDGFGLTVLEAMACGCPVMTTKTTGASELITHGVDGFVYDTPEQCCAALKEINEIKERLPEIGEKAIKTAEKYTWDVYREKFGKWAKESIE